MAKAKRVWFFVAASLVALAADSAQTPQSFDSVDRQAILTKPGTRFIENIFWPSEAEVSAKRLATDLVRKDIEQFEFILTRAVKKEFLPSRETIQRDVIPLEAFRGGYDYLVLRYQSAGYDFQIEYARALYILVTPQKSERQPLDNSAQYVESTAQCVLNVPATDEAGKEATLFVAPENPGEWRFGERFYQGCPPPKHWYSGIPWWSDGHSVLFLTSAWLQEDFTHGHQAWSDASAPGTFAYKRAAAPQNEGP
jgi:hypothetical protein